jgi:hypothetical protein
MPGALTVWGRLMLLNDQTRCTGQPIGGAWICPERGACERYRVFREFSDSQHELPTADRGPHHWPLISVAIRFPSEDCPLYMEAGHG